ncbi:MAG: translation initiation factor IF-2 N-terminal domain-containing protein [Caldisericia bacterium]
MSRIRIDELAKQLGVDEETIISKAKELGARPKNATSSIEDSIAFKIRASVGVIKAPMKSEKLDSREKVSAEKELFAVDIKPDIDDDVTKDLLQDVEAALKAVEVDTEPKKQIRKSLLPRKKPAPVLKKKVVKKRPLPPELQKELDRKKREKAEALKKEEEERLKAEAEEKRRLEEEEERRRAEQEEAEAEARAKLKQRQRP